MAKLCYMTSMYSSEKASIARRTWSEEIMQNLVPRYILRTEEKVEPTSQVEELKLEGKLKVWIGSQLNVEQKEKIGSLLLKNINNFAEHSEKMNSIDHNIIEHCLEEILKAKPTR